ncbi:hypothetical protein NPIL_610941 [Nephila pilipes]|uniref:Uncharacterized protein n=1 Tax=Nephila pilipes TaxID=299642 RepID=A0A8X6QX80_NEPPI|nr:hypothetical protein NPIL_610941 [Nephila pilipes]
MSREQKSMEQEYSVLLHYFGKPREESKLVEVPKRNGLSNTTKKKANQLMGVIVPPLPKAARVTKFADGYDVPSSLCCMNQLSQILNNLMKNAGPGGSPMPRIDHDSLRVSGGSLLEAIHADVLTQDENKQYATKSFHTFGLIGGTLLLSVEMMWVW